MNTPSHFLMTAALQKALPGLRMARSAVLLGSIAPDLPLYLLSLGAMLYYRRLLGWSTSESAQHIFGTLYFQDPWWIALHSMLHSPVTLLAGLVVVQYCRRRWHGLAHWLHWFLLACLLHSAVDIATHYDDGPVVFWPLNWSFRISSPVSYWDRAHFGSEFARFELALGVCLTAYLVLPWLWRRLFAPREES